MRKKLNIFGIILLFSYPILLKGQTIDSYYQYSPAAYPTDGAFWAISNINIIDISFVIFLLCIAFAMWKKEKIKKWYTKQKDKKEGYVYYTKMPTKKHKS